MTTKGIRNSISEFRRVSILIIVVVSVGLILSCSNATNDSGTSSATQPYEAAANAIDINSATTDELEKIPHIGRKLAERIVAHRETYGRFRRSEHMLLVQGISEKTFREIRPMIRAD